MKKLQKNYERYYPMNRLMFQDMCGRYPKASKKSRVRKKWARRLGLIWKDDYDRVQ
jgi:hypothetical protein